VFAISFPMHTYITEWSILVTKKKIYIYIYIDYQFFFPRAALGWVVLNLLVAFIIILLAPTLFLVSVVSLVYFTACVFPTVVIISSQPTVVAQTVVCVVWVVWVYVVGGTLVSGKIHQCTINAKNTVLYTTQTL